MGRGGVLIGRRLRFAIFQQEVIRIIKDNVRSVQMMHCLFFVFAPANSSPCFRVARLVIVSRFPIVTNSPPETGGVPRSGVGVDVIFVIGRFTQRPYC